MAIRLVVDSTCDYEISELKKKNITCVPLSINFDGTEYKDVFGISKAEFYNKLVKEKLYPKTSQPSPADFFKVFSEIKEAGDTAVVITISSALSGTYQSAVIAKDMAEYDKIYVIDSLTATVGIRIMAEKALKMIDELKNEDDAAAAEKICAEIESLKPRIKIRAALDTLEYLYRGGRLSRMQKNAGEMISLKPIITVNTKGEVSLLSSALGKTRAIKNLAKNLNCMDIDKDYPIYYVYSENENNLNELKEKITPWGEEITCHIGATIGSHVGDNAYGYAVVVKE